MSIYATWLHIHDPEAWSRDMAASGINAIIIGEGDEEAESRAPIVYQGSHILPSDEDRRGGAVDLAAVPAHISREGRESGPHDWMRLSVYCEQSDTQYQGKPLSGAGRAVVVLDRDQVKALRDTMTEWLEREEQPS